jgi:hypothetical protein
MGIIKFFKYTVKENMTADSKNKTELQKQTKAPHFPLNSIYIVSCLMLPFALRPEC